MRVSTAGYLYWISCSPVVATYSGDLPNQLWLLVPESLEYLFCGSTDFHSHFDERCFSIPKSFFNIYHIILFIEYIPIISKKFTYIAIMVFKNYRHRCSHLKVLKYSVLLSCNGRWSILITGNTIFYSLYNHLHVVKMIILYKIYAFLLCHCLNFIR